MKNDCIETLELSDILSNENLISKYSSLYDYCLFKTKKFCDSLSLQGRLLFAKEIFISEKIFLINLMEAFQNTDKNLLIYDENSTLLVYLPKVKDLSEIVETEYLEKNNRVNDISELFKSNFEFEKIHIKDNSLFLLNGAKNICLAERLINSELIEELILKGVYVQNSFDTRISPESQIEKGVIISSSVTIEGESRIEEGAIIEEGVKISNSIVGKNTVVGKGSSIINSEIGSNVTIINSLITESFVSDEVKIGPYAQLRPNSKIGKKSKIGNFVEIKNTVIGENTKLSHLTYVGDADVGSNVNIGCGVVFVNYDGNKKYRSIVEDNAFIGCNVNLVSPVKIGEGSFIAAGSTITDEVQKNQFAIARSRQTNKDGWELN